MAAAPTADALDALRGELARVWAERREVASYHAAVQAEGAARLQQLAGSGLSAEDVEARVAALCAPPPGGALAGGAGGGGGAGGPSDPHGATAGGLTPLERTLIELNRLRLEVARRSAATAAAEAGVAEGAARARRAGERVDRKSVV